MTIPVYTVCYNIMERSFGCQKNITKAAFWVRWVKERSKRKMNKKFVEEYYDLKYPDTYIETAEEQDEKFKSMG